METVNLKPQLGETQSMSFAMDAPVPFYELTAGAPSAAARESQHGEEVTEKGAEGVVDEGYAGKAKGMK